MPDVLDERLRRSTVAESTRAAWRSPSRAEPRGRSPGVPARFELPPPVELAPPARLPGAAADAAAAEPPAPARGAAPGRSSCAQLRGSHSSSRCCRAPQPPSSRRRRPARQHRRAARVRAGAGRAAGSSRRSSCVASRAAIARSSTSICGQTRSLLRRGRHDLVRPRSPVARHRRHRRAARRGRPGVLRGSGRDDRLRHLGRLPAAARLDRRAPRGRARAGARHQRVDAGRRVSVRRARRAPAMRWSSSGPRMTGRCFHCATAAPTSGWSSSSPTGSTRARWSSCSPTGAAPKLAHIIPNFQNPAGYTLSAAKRERLLELAREHDFTVFEDDPYAIAALRGRAAGDDAVDGPRARRLRIVVLQDRLPGDPRRLPGRIARS